MLVSESYKKRLQELAGILLKEDLYNFTDQEKKIAFKDSDKRVKGFSKDLMTKAIKEGWELGISFKTDNDKDKMPIAKERIIYPVAMGITSHEKGNLAIRAFHKIGQSESAARKTKKRSQEVKDEWRLFKASNIKSMWFTGNFFRLESLGGYREIGDKGLAIVEVQSKKSEVVKFQKDYYKKMKNKTAIKPKTVLINDKPEDPEKPKTAYREPQIKKGAPQQNEVPPSGQQVNDNPQPD